MVAERKGRMASRTQSERRPNRAARLVNRAFKDSRIAAAWPVIANAIYEVEKYKFDALEEEKKETRRPPKARRFLHRFREFFRDTVSTDLSLTASRPPSLE